MKELTLNVCGTELTTFMSDRDGMQAIALKPLCETLGIRFTQQLEKLKKNPQFQLYYLSSTAAQDGKNREMVCIPVRQVGMWICNINANRVKPEVKEKVLQFQEYLQEVIYQALFNEVTPEQFRVLETKVSTLVSIVQTQQARIDALEIDNQRLLQSQVSHSASLMSNKRWVKRDRTIKTAL